jgi:hypothetical protein
VLFSGVVSDTGVMPLLLQVFRTVVLVMLDVTFSLSLPLMTVVLIV